jgi:hypothetical protein
MQGRDHRTLYLPLSQEVAAAVLLFHDL